MSSYDRPRFQPGRTHTDPNHAGGVYRGQRMDGEGHGAPYGWLRRAHAADLESFGGFRGAGEPRIRARFHPYDRLYGAPGSTDGYDRGYRGAPRGYDSGLRGYDRGRSGGYDRPMRRDVSGGVARSWDDVRYLRDFNAHSAGLRDPGDRGRRFGRAGQDETGRGGAEGPLRRLHREGIDPDYANRGRGSGGFTDG